MRLLQASLVWHLFISGGGVFYTSSRCTTHYSLKPLLKVLGLFPQRLAHGRCQEVSLMTPAPSLNPCDMSSAGKPFMNTSHRRLVELLFVLGT